MLRHILWLIATIAAFALCLTAPYPFGARTWANGIPLPYVIWEQLENGAWVDFVGFLTVVAIPLDFTVAVVISFLHCGNELNQYPFLRLSVHTKVNGRNCDGHRLLHRHNLKSRCLDATA